MTCPFPVSNRFAVVDDAGRMMLSADPEADNVKSTVYLPQETPIRWTTQEWLRYIRGLETGGASEGHYALADGNYGFTGSPNPEIIAAWYSAILKQVSKVMIQQFILKK